jgi:hypothetical protein
VSQDLLRTQIKLVKVYHNDIYYKDFANYLNIAEHSFYNWLNGYYELSYQKAQELQDIVIDLLD